MNQPNQPNPQTPQEQPAQVPEHTVGGEPACPSVFDKPDPDRYPKKEKQPRKPGSRQTRNIIIALVLCVTLVLSASGVCRLLYQKSLWGFVTDYFSEGDPDDSSQVSTDTEQTYIFDYSAYTDSDADTDTLKLGGVKSVEIQNELDTYTIKSHWGTEEVTDEQTLETSMVDVLKWLITDVKGKDVGGVKFSTTTVGFVTTDLFRIAYDSVYAEDGTATIPQGTMTYYDECGITKSQNRSTITFENGASVTVIIGDESPTGNFKFVAVENNPGSHPDAVGAPVEDKRIYKVENANVVYLEKEAIYFVSKDIVSPVEAEETRYDENGDEITDPYFISGALSYFEELSISGLSYQKDFEFTIVEEDKPGYDSIYLMTSPYTQNVDLTAMETLLAPVADGLSASGCLVMKADNSQMRKYGLDDPACVVRYVVKEQEYLIKIGSQVNKETNTYAVMVKDNPSIMEVPADSLQFMTYDEADFASDTLYSCEITEIQSIRVQMQDGTDHLFRLSHGKDEEGLATLSVVTRNGKVIDEAAFRNMYVDLLSLTSFTNVTDGKDAASPYMTITLNYNDFDQTDVIRLSPYSDRRYFMSLNGMGSTVVLSTAVETLANSILGLVK